MYSILESTPQFHTDPLSSQIGSTQGPHLFSTQNPSIQHQKPLSSTHLSVQHTRQFNVRDDSRALKSMYKIHSASCDEDHMI